MAMSKAMLGVFLGALMICSLFSQNANAETVSVVRKRDPIKILTDNGNGPVLGYGSIGGDEYKCSKKNPGACTPKPSNPYQRGCEPTNRCHDNSTGGHH